MSGRVEVFDVERFSSAEEALFAGLMFLLRWFYKETGLVPGRGILSGVISAFEALLTRGRLPAGGRWERLFLGRLLAIVEQVVARDDGGFLDEQIPWIRRLILDAEGRDPDDDGGENGPGGNGAPPGGAGFG